MTLDRYLTLKTNDDNQKHQSYFAFSLTNKNDFEIFFGAYKMCILRMPHFRSWP